MFGDLKDVNIGTGNADIDQDFSGKATVPWEYIYSNKGNIMNFLSITIDINKSEYNIFKELIDLRNNNMELFKSIIKNESNQFNPADNPNHGYDSPLGPEGTEERYE